MNVSGTSVLIVAGLAASLRNFRGELIRALLARGHKVHAAAPGLMTDAATRDWLMQLGVSCHDVPMARTGMNPLADLTTCLSLWRLMRRLGVQAYLGYTIKPVIWGLIAARLAGVPGRVGLITGLGYAFTGKARGKRQIIQKLAVALYRLALKQATLVFFQNPDDRADFGKLGILPPGLRVEVVNGSGVDTDRFTPVPLPDGPPRFLMIARLVADKGVRVFADAARALRQTHPYVRCEIVGGLDPNPAAISRQEIESWVAEGILDWPGELSDVRPALARAHVYVLPSFREGTPRTVLEAMATGRAIITTDAPGCRETVQHGVNGLLVPVQDSAALADACRRLIDAPDLISDMAAASRRIAEERYDVRKVNAAMLSAMRL